MKTKANLLTASASNILYIKQKQNITTFIVVDSEYSYTISFDYRQIQLLAIKYKLGNIGGEAYLIWRPLRRIKKRKQVGMCVE